MKCVEEDNFEIDFVLSGIVDLAPCQHAFGWLTLV